MNSRVWVYGYRTEAPLERRNQATRMALVDRIRGEFREMRGVSLSEREAARLMGVQESACARILHFLIDEGSLRVNIDGRYMVADAMP